MKRQVALAGAGAVLFIVSPAFGITPPRHAVDFASAPRVPGEFASVVHSSRGHPLSRPITLTAVPRRVATVPWGGQRTAIVVAPIHGGGFCLAVAGAYGGSSCGWPKHSRTNLSYEVSGDASGPIALSGYFFDPRASRLAIIFGDSTRELVPIVWVNRPINAGFFAVRLAALHRHTGYRPQILDCSQATVAR